MHRRFSSSCRTVGRTWPPRNIEAIGDRPPHEPIVATLQSGKRKPTCGAGTSTTDAAEPEWAADRRARRAMNWPRRRSFEAIGTRSAMGSAPHRRILNARIVWKCQIRARRGFEKALFARCFGGAGRGPGNGVTHECGQSTRSADRDSRGGRRPRRLRSGQAERILHLNGLSPGQCRGPARRRRT